MREKTLALTLALAALSAAACNESKFGGDKDAAKKKKTHAEQSAGDADGSLGNTVEDDDEVEKADEPAMVSGSFLTCAEDPALAGTTVNNAAVGCVVKAGGVKQSLAGLTAAWSVLDAYNNEQKGLAFQPAADDSAYNTTVIMPRSSLGAAKVRVEVHRGDKASVFVAPVATKEKVVPSGAQVKTFGAAGDFRLGDGRFSTGWNRGCVQALQSIELSGKRMSVPFTVEAGGSVGILLEDMCGVSVGSDRVLVYRDGVKIYEAPITVEAVSHAVTGFEATPGHYELVVRSLYNDESGDFDDFVVGKVTFTYSAQLSFGEPVAADE